MKRKILVGIGVLLGLAVAPLLIAGALVAVWIYLARVVWKSNREVFHDQIEPELAEKRLKRLKAFLMVAGIWFVVFIVGAIVHNVLYGISEIEEPVSFIVALVALCVFVIATIVALVMFLKGRRKTNITS